MGVCSLFCCAEFSVVSSFAIISLGMRGLVALLKFIFLISCKCSVCFPCGTVGLHFVILGFEAILTYFNIIFLVFNII